MFSLLSIVALASAHNWVNGPARTSTKSNIASQVFPVLDSSINEPHVVVRAGQRFQFEWVTGHNADTYISLIRKDDAARLVSHSGVNVTFFENFLKDPQCPTTAPTGLDQVYHYKFRNESTTFYPTKDQNGNFPPPTPDFYQRIVPRTDPAFIPRPLEFNKGMKNMPAISATNTRQMRSDGVTQMQYKAADIQTNRRCFPATPVPRAQWVIGLIKARHVKHQPSEPDVTWLSFPPGTPPGDYIVHWAWRSYYDAVDVRVVAGTADVRAPFGGVDLPGTPQTKFARIDHCRMPNATLAGTCFKMTQISMPASDVKNRMDVPQACLDACKKMPASRCDGVAVVPLRNADTVAQGFRNLVQIPFGTDCVKPAAGDAATHMCFPVLQRAPTDVYNSFLVTSDLEDPSYYATCYRRSDLLPREGLPDPTTLPEVTASKQNWKATNGCVTCAQAQTFSTAQFSPIWEAADVCRNCDID